MSMSMALRLHTRHMGCQRGSRDLLDTMSVSQLGIVAHTSSWYMLSICVHYVTEE